METLGYTIECSCGVTTNTKSQRNKHLTSRCHKDFIMRMEMGIIDVCVETKRHYIKENNK